MILKTKQPTRCQKFNYRLELLYVHWLTTTSWTTFRFLFLKILDCRVRDMIPAQHFSVIHAQRHVWWDLERGSFRGWILLRIFKPCCECTKVFLKSPLILGVFKSYPLGDRTCPTKRKSQYFFFFWKRLLFGHKNAQHDILGIHDYP